MPSPILLAVIAGAWALAIAAELTGRAQWVHHHELIEGTLPLGATLVLFLVAWQAHIAAMMLPSSLPLIRLFRRASQDQPRPGMARGAFRWALMLVMFVVGIANLAWMAPFALLMIYEKTGPGGDRAVGPFGIGLTVLGALVALDPTWLPDLVGSAHHP